MGALFLLIGFVMYLASQLLRMVKFDSRYKPQ